MGKLSGIRVIDLSVFLPGPMMTVMMADQGAEVSKIETPTGDPAREQGPFEAGQSATIGSADNSVNWSGREDSNLRPPHPQCDALPGCATSRPAIRRTMAPALERGLYGQRFRKARGQSRYPLRGKWQHDNGPPLE